MNMRRLLLACGHIALGVAVVLVFSANGFAGAKETVVHSFLGSPDGSETSVYGTTAGLVADSEGNLYGTTYQGGPSGGNCAGNCGTVFELSPPATSGGSWTETIIYNFQVAPMTAPIPTVR